jgi:hypothetical protein
MEALLLPLAALVGVSVGPIIVARLRPNQVSGNATAGESAASAVFWGVPLGLAFFYLVVALMILATREDLASLPTKLGIITIVFSALALICAPLLVCGFHKWRWDSDGVEFVGVFRRRVLPWKNVIALDRLRRTGWTLRASDNSKLSITGYIPGAQVILQALLMHRPDLMPSVTSALEDETP